MEVMRKFVSIDLGRERVVDETTICKFRHWLESQARPVQIFERIDRYLGEQERQIKQGTIVNAMIIDAPSSTRNRKQSRDLEMHQTRKSNQWYFEMKVHLGVDREMKLIHSVVVTPANRHDSQVIGEWKHSNETQVWGDSAYTGQGK